MLLHYCIFVPSFIVFATVLFCVTVSLLSRFLSLLKSVTVLFLYQRLHVFVFVTVPCLFFVSASVLYLPCQSLFKGKCGGALTVCCGEPPDPQHCIGCIWTSPLPWRSRRQPTLMTQENQCRVSLTEESEERLLNILLFHPLCGAADARKTEPRAATFTSGFVSSWADAAFSVYLLLF